MARARLPFATTTVPAHKSMSELQVMLQELKFDVVAGVIESKRMVAARHGKAEFRFEADPIKVLVIQGIRRPNPMQIEQADRIAWRYLAWSVKNLCDGIKLGLVEVSQAFGGYLVFRDPETKLTTTLASYITEKVASGYLDSSSSIAGLIEDKR